MPRRRGAGWKATSRAACARYGDIVIDHPRDLLALQVAHVGDFFLGQSTMLRDRVAQVLPHWNATVPGYGYVLGMHAFGLEETGLYDRAEDAGRKALDTNRRDPWAVHAVAHVMEMQGRIRDGIEFLGSRATGLVGQQRARLPQLVAPGAASPRARRARPRARDLRHPDPPGRDLRSRSKCSTHRRCSGVSRLRGVDVGARWKSLAASWQPLAEDRFYAFNDAHAVMAFVGAGDWAGVDRAIASLERAAQEPVRTG